MEEIKELQRNGFNGFISVKNLKSNHKCIPPVGGVYVVIRDTEEAPEFLEKGTGGFFKGKNPNVGIEELEANYVGSSRIMYIGKGNNLKRRIRQLLQFASGKNIGHWGGRYLWQLADSDNLLIAWKELPTTDDPHEVESEMLEDFLNTHGKLPFANLTR